MTKTCDARQDLIRRLGPLERLRPFVRDVDVATDGRLQFPGAAVNATPKLFLGERAEPASAESTGSYACWRYRRRGGCPAGPGPRRRSSPGTSEFSGAVALMELA